MSRFNKEQIQAASHIGGHALVLAGPGTGKTSTLVARHSFLRSKGTASEQILVSTFTQKAAEELKSRLDQSIDGKCWIGTFHGICHRLLRRFSEEANLRKNYKVLDVGGQRELLNKAGVIWDADDGELTDIISRWKDSMQSPDQAQAEAYRKNNTVLQRASEHFLAYEEELKQRGDLDFADLITKSLSLVQSSAPVREFVKERITHALVDEFQDVNRAQMELLLALASCGTVIWAVADDDQALYGWRGASVHYTVNFGSYFNNATRYTLATNYRCDPAIIAAANTVIANNTQRVKKELRPSRKHRDQNKVRIRSFIDESEEAEWIANELHRYRQKGANLSDIGILMRTSSITPAIQQALESKKIPFTLSGTQSFWDLPEVAAVTELLLAIEKGISGRTGRFKGALDIVETMKGATPKNAAPAVGRLIGNQPPQGSTGERAAIWSDNSEAAAKLASQYPSASSFNDHVSSMNGKADTFDPDGVVISTIHSSKGLEWKHVFIVGCEASMMPHHRTNDPEEERRLFYVALTRTRGAVDICYAKKRFDRNQTPSPFLHELRKSPAGAVIWSGFEEPEVQKKQSNIKSPTTNTDNGSPKVYKRRGGRSLIPPEER